MAAEFRTSNDFTPIIIMGYCNPVHHMGYANFAKKAKDAGIDGAIIVDLPPEEDSELRAAFEAHDLALIRLATPTTDSARLPRVVAGTKGFVYYVSMTTDQRRLCRWCARLRQPCIKPSRARELSNKKALLRGPFV